MSTEKRFYDRHYCNISINHDNASENIGRDIEKRGGRYYCIYDFLSNPAEMDALEWGFGDMARCFYFSELFRNYHAVDISSDVIAKKFGVSINDLPFTFSCVNLNEDLPFDDGSFDVIIAMMIIEHLFDPFHSAKEISRLLKKGGMAFVNIPIITGIKNRLRLLAGIMPNTSSKDWWDKREWDGGHLHYFTINNFTRLCHENSLNIIKMYPVGRMYTFKKLHPALFCNEVSFVLKKTN